jgi:hypothetical protein
LDEIRHRVIQDRYDLCFEKEKGIFYELDKKRRLWAFYEALSRRPKNVAPVGEHIETLQWLDRVVRRGQYYIEEAGLDYQPEQNDNEEIYYRLEKAEERGRDQGRRDAGIA